MWEFAKGNTFGALAFSSYGAFWLSFWYLRHPPAQGVRVATPDKAVGIYLLIWTIFTVYMIVAAMRTSGAIMAVFAAADADLPVPRPSAPTGGTSSGMDQGRRLARPRDRGRRLVRVVRRRLQLHAQAGRPAAPSRAA